MVESSPELSPDQAAREQHDRHLVHSADTAGYLAEVALNMSAWAPYIDWSSRLGGEGVTSSRAVLDAFRNVSRYDFLPSISKPRTAEDRPLPIGAEQTNSQPSTVATMLDWLDVQPGQKILDVGVGSGWTTALLADIVGRKGAIHGTERILELTRLSKSNLARYDYPQATIHYTPKRLGLRSEAPYDRILVSAATKPEWMRELFSRQLSENGGIIVVPLANDSSHGNSKFDKEIVAVKNEGGDMKFLNKKDGYSFVPLMLG